MIQKHICAVLCAALICTLAAACANQFLNNAFGINGGSGGIGGSGGSLVEYAIPPGGQIIHISSQAQLAAINSHLDDPAFNNGKNAYVLDNDIALSGTWTPIGRADTVNSYGTPTGGIHTFGGNFYGNRHTISNMDLPGTSKQIGLFGHVDGGLIQDLLVEPTANLTIAITSGAPRIGMIVGHLESGAIKNCGVYSSSGITVNGSGYSKGVAGIVGYFMPGGLIEGCYAALNITVTSGSTHNQISGIVCGNEGTVRNSYYAGNLTGTNNYVYAEGIAYSGTSMNSYSVGTITNNSGNGAYSWSSGIMYEGTTSNCVSLMSAVTLSVGTKIARINSNTTSSTHTNNYAYSGMTLNGSPVSSTNANDRDGQDKTAAQLKQRGTYETGLGWDFATVWEMGPPSYPFPILKWQNGVVHIPPGFTVIN